MYRLSGYELRNLFFEKKLSAVEITKYFLNRIEKLDPQIRSFIQVLPKRAIDKAKKLDDKRAKNQKLGKLAAIPIAIKDNTHIKGINTTCASHFLKNYKATFDATVVRLFEEDDAIIIGKTNLDEFAMGSSNEKSAFFPTYNPWDLSRVSGGSSGGSSAAIASRFCSIATGSDTGGSIRLPGAFCGVVGYKPTYGRVSRHGLVAFGSSLDQIGTLTSNVKDTALAMEVLGKHCRYDSTSLDFPIEPIVDNLKEDLKDIKIGVPFHFLENLSGDIIDTFHKNLDILKSLGAQIIDINLDLMKYSVAVYYIIATAEASTNLARFDGIRYGRRSPNATTIGQVYDMSREEGFGAEVKKRIMLGTYVLSSGYQDAYYKKAQKVRTLMINAFENAFQTCDLVAMPVATTDAFKVNSIQDPIKMYYQDLFTIPANLAGLPAISVPCGFSSNNLPLGLQLIGPQLHDALLLSHAHAFEKQCKQSKIPPAFDKE
jgi:aspartyl-tRNA(Asn)/glutamyl-tRNA(Gln) amidotransferase subunit A